MAGVITHSALAADVPRILGRFRRQLRRAAGKVRIDPRLLAYINSLVRLTRQWPQFHLGASPRAGIAG